LADYDFPLGRALQQPELTQAQREADEEDLYAGLIGLAGIVVDDLTVDELLTQVPSLPPTRFRAPTVPV
jgi:hypothetical protein